jgi:hypothetical protein
VRGLRRGSDTECYSVGCEGLGKGIVGGTVIEYYPVCRVVVGNAIYEFRGTDTECYFVCCEGLWRAI